jgi:hypothetical protein
LKHSLATVGVAEIKLQLFWLKFLMTTMIVSLLLRVVIDCLLF